MNTLKYKVLFSNSFLVFVWGLLFYLLLTLPALVYPPMYLISASYALSFGWIACLLFMAFFLALVRVKAGWHARRFLLYLLVAVSVLVAFEFLELLGVQYDIWQSGFFLLFPGTAIVAGWLAILVMRRRVQQCFVIAAPSTRNA